jgi:BirA family biotin operon repressor/biotin-[acetyl-CoA-carboxylase] ligase
MEIEQLKSGRRIFVYDTCGSTMDLMYELVRGKTADPYDSVLSKIQTRGRGQMQKEWIAPEGNLNASMLFPKDLFRKNGWPENLMPLLAGYAVTEVLALCGVDTKIKWPNDIVFMEKKLGGILVEKKSQGYILGVGINIKTRPCFTKEDNGFFLAPVCVADILGSVVDPVVLWRETAEFLFEFFKKTLEKETPMVFNRKFIRKCVWINETVEYSPPSSGVETAFLKGVSPSGALILERNNEEFEVFSGRIRKPGKRIR